MITGSTMETMITDDMSGIDISRTCFAFWTRFANTIDLLEVVQTGVTVILEVFVRSTNDFTSELAESRLGHAFVFR